MHFPQKTMIPLVVNPPPPPTGGPSLDSLELTVLIALL